MDIQALIRERGLKQNWIADQLGISAPYFSLILSGRRPLPEVFIKPLAKLLRVRVSDMVQWLE